jgi:hypothetical protein
MAVFSAITELRCRENCFLEVSLEMEMRLLRDRL